MDPTITSCPSLTSPRSTSVDAPSLSPSVSVTGAGLPSGPTTQTRPAVPLRASPADAVDLLVARLLLVGEDLANARPLGLADLLGLRAALCVGQALKAAHQLAALLEDRIQLGLLQLRETSVL